MSHEASRHRKRIGQLLIAWKLPWDYTPESRSMGMELPLCVLCRLPNPNPQSSACPTCIPPDEGEIRAQGRVSALEAELEMTADKLSDCHLWLDTAARLQDGSCIDIIRKSAQRLLRKHQCPGWKDGGESAESEQDESDRMHRENNPHYDKGHEPKCDADPFEDRDPEEEWCDSCGNTGWIGGADGISIECGDCNN